MLSLLICLIIVLIIMINNQKQVLAKQTWTLVILFSNKFRKKLRTTATENWWNFKNSQLEPKNYWFSKKNCGLIENAIISILNNRCFAWVFFVFFVSLQLFFWLCRLNPNSRASFCRKWIKNAKANRTPAPRDLLSHHYLIINDVLAYRFSENS